MNDFLPMSKTECVKIGWSELDIIIVTGDAYVDHHSFGAALIGRYLVSKGFRVGVIAQPDFRFEKDFTALGKPRLFFGVTAGNIDSMLNHYTARRKIRTSDSYSPNGEAGLRPDRATIVYTQKLKQIYKDVPIIIGGIEASLRRIPHYDFWQDKIRNSILFDSKADLLIYGMAEKTTCLVAEKLQKGISIKRLQDIRGTVSIVKDKDDNDAVMLPDYESVSNKDIFLQMTKTFLDNYERKTLYQPFGNRFLRHNKPPQALTTDEIDYIYALPFSRKPHPKYKAKVIPAYEQIKDSVTSHRGCFGGCNFCTLYLHQGRKIISRSKMAIVNEIKKYSSTDSFRGTVSDIGGPSANMYGISCEVSECTRKSCLRPGICSNLDTSHREYLELLSRCGEIPGVKHIFISSGIRTDLALQSKRFIQKLAVEYTGGRTKVAPEHKSGHVLTAMNKQDFSTYEKFEALFMSHCNQHEKKFFVTPYFMVGHPGTTLNDAIDLAVYLKKNRLKIEQIQEFTPTPMTVSTTIYFTGKDVSTGKDIYVPKGREIHLQKALAQWFIPENKKYIIEALKKAKRTDLISFFLD